MMKNHWVMRVFAMLIGLLNASLAFSQGKGNEIDRSRKNQTEKLKNEKPAIVIQHDGNPFRPKASIHARLEYVDSQSPGILWFREVGTPDPNDPTQFIMKTERDRVLTVLFGTEEKIAALDNAFNKRRRLHESNGVFLRNVRLQELDRELTSKGVPKSLLHSKLDAEVDSETIEDAFAEYVAVEQKAERELADELDEILPPSQMEVLVERWIKADSLFTPISSVYFGLDEDQVRAIERDSTEFKKLNLKLTTEMSSKAAELQSRNKSNQFDWITEKNNNVQLWEARLRPFSHLTPSQFKKALFCLPLKNWVKHDGFRGRLDTMEARKQEVESPSEKAERKILTALYRKGLELEKAVKQ